MFSFLFIHHICIFLFFPAPFSLDAESRLLVATEELDREQVTKYHLVITCADHGRPRLSSTAALTISVQDVNDHSPLFQQTVYRVQLLEQSPVGSVILYPLATDQDCGQNAVVTYNLYGPEERYFSIDSNTGLIRIVHPIRLSELPRNVTTLELTVRATDGGSPPRTSEATILVSLVICFTCCSYCQRVGKVKHIFVLIDV